MTTYSLTSGFHDTWAGGYVAQYSPSHWDRKFTYTFENFFHPFIGELVQRLNQKSLPGVLDASWQNSLKTADPITQPLQDFFNLQYHPVKTSTVAVEHFPKQIDLTTDGPYANYNWELFFHVPLTIAVHLSKTQRFAEAQRWFHYIFDPTSNDESVPVPERFWKFLGFREGEVPQQIDELLALLSKTPANQTELDLQTTILAGYQAILNKPFQPHAVARTRHIAYQYSVVMKYLDNLIAWGDQPVPAGHTRVHQRGDAALRAGGEHFGRASAAHSAARHCAGEDFRAAESTRPRSYGERARGVGGKFPVQPFHAAVG